MVTRMLIRRSTAEVLVIVVGVLLALWAEAWRESRAEHRLAYSYMQRLGADVQSDSVRFARIRFLHQQYREAANELLRVLNAETEADPIETAHLLARAGYLSPDNTVTSTYEDLVSSGRLFLIQDEVLRGSVQSYYSDLARRLQGLEDAPIGLRNIARRWLPGDFSREAQQCLWPEVDQHLGLPTPEEQQCHPEISLDLARQVLTRMTRDKAQVADFLNEVIWYSRDVEAKLRVQESRRASLQVQLEAVAPHATQK